jgi:Fe-S-cluster-containing dehydrogenase component
MHCRDPACMIGCPTGAIHRHETAGVVVINDDTCIGCGTCANSCPYDNIRLVEIANSSGVPVVDDEGRPIVKATKCDLCVEQLGGPACARACPHDALRRVSASALVEHEATTTTGTRRP